MAISQKKYNGDLVASINLAIDAIGGMAKFISPGDRVLIKPNFNTADPFPASTSYDMLEAVVKLVYQQGAKEVIVGDSSTVTANTRRVMTKLGVYNLEKLTPPAKIISFDDGEWVRLVVPDAKFLKSVCIPKILDEVDKVILLPCLKTHFIARYTGALKLAVGFMKPMDRLAMHSGRVEEKVAELNKVIPFDLVIMDARLCFITKGPMEGEVREPNLILASDSRIEIDIAGVNIIKSFPGNDLADVNADDLTQIKLAKIIGVK